MTTNNQQIEKGASCEMPRSCQSCGTQWPLMRKIQVALLILGIAFLVIFLLARLEGFFSSRAAIESFEISDPVLASEAAAVEQMTAVDDELASPPDFAGWGEGRIRAYEDSAKKWNHSPMAILEIPSMHLKVPVFDGTDTLTLNHAVGRIAGTALPGAPGNIGIAGHRDGFFRGLRDIKQGDEIDLRTHGGTDVYTVDHVQIVAPRDVSVLRPQDRSAVTLVTCYPFYFVGNAPKRFVVTAYLTQHSTAGSTTSEARLNPQPFNPSQEEQ
jgi:sortase A